MSKREMAEDEVSKVAMFEVETFEDEMSENVTRPSQEVILS